ncbi:MAG: tRNA-2-methylthio-N(6)-dimethylallyladenosine synthase [Thiotrichaceae bacterium]|nr:MAG: tRNA-2-methylthio-N(6)-dimethylallyladenosine synthase [Thiotrichaceae bacterium]
MASQEGDLIRKRAPYVDIVLGPQSIHRLPNIIKKIKSKEEKNIIDIDFSVIEKFDSIKFNTDSKISEFITIMEGCSKYCSYCVVPYTRGTEVSRSLNSILKEAKFFISNGAKELVLLGQNVNAYNYKSSNEICDFGLLLFYISQLSNLKRIRYTTSHPNNFSASVYKAYQHIPKLVNHLHLPIQSGSDKILASMKRGYTVIEYKSVIKKLLEIRPSMTFSSDFIVGFPGETDDDFQKTLDIIEEINFDVSYSFVYSKRPGTPATYYKDNVEDSVKKKRLHKLQDLLNRMLDTRLKNMQGSTQRILVEGVSKKGDNLLTGRTENNTVVNFKGKCNSIGNIVDVRITDKSKNTLKGEII